MSTDCLSLPVTGMAPAMAPAGPAAALSPRQQRDRAAAARQAMIGWAVTTGLGGLAWAALAWVALA